MTDAMTQRALDEISKRSLPKGGFAPRAGGCYCPAATAWAILAMRLCGGSDESLHDARQSILTCQIHDGRVVKAAAHPEVYWPTSLSVLAWLHSPEFSRCLTQAASFLLQSTGTHFKRRPDSPGGHDTSIRGWAWTEDTHSWVEPTSLAMIALRLAGYGSHERVSEGSRLLLDRQLPRGGWNYGNTTVFGTELASMPESTGLALSALPELTARQNLSHSIAMMKESIRALKTPLSLGWAVLGLSAWGERPADANDLIDRCLKRQSRYGTYDTQMIGLMLVARQAEGGLIHALS